MGRRALPEHTLVLGLDLSRLQSLFSEARRLGGQTEFVVVGSLSILGVVQRAAEIPARMLMSIDVDCYTRPDAERIFELARTLGQGSSFEAEHGYYLDPISPNLPTLPDPWEHRLIRVPLDDGIVVSFLDPNDAAVSKYARCDVRDREWIRAGLASGLLSAAVIESRFRDTRFLDVAEEARAREALTQDRRGARRTR